MKIFTVEQIRRLDAYTIANEPIPSIELMERAARAFVKWFTRHFPDAGQRIHVFCGPGNNGGDGLAIARMLSREFYNVNAYTLNISPKTSEDFQTNYKNLKKHRCHIYDINAGDNLPAIPAHDIIIDAIFGSGLNKPVQGYWADLIQHLNSQPARRVAVDIPSGMYADSLSQGLSIHADYTLSFELPKLSFLVPENYERVGEWTIESIGLLKDFIDKEDSMWYFVKADSVRPLLRRRKKHEHKGNFGHAMLVVGGYGKVGAAILAAKGCLRSGVGLLTLHAPACAYEILQSTVPEAMVSIDNNALAFSTLPPEMNRYTAVGAGCGIGTDPMSSKALEHLLGQYRKPVVLDADAINLLSARPSIIEKIPAGSILTPHPKEFERLFGKSEDSFSRIDLMLNKARQHQFYIVLKGAYTATATPQGKCYFNSSGNPGMASGGSGDVLTGIITGLLAQGYSSLESCLIGVYLHGLAGDLAAEALGQEVMIASDILSFMGKAFTLIRASEFHQ